MYNASDTKCCEGLIITFNRCVIKLLGGVILFLFCFFFLLLLYRAGFFYMTGYIFSLYSLPACLCGYGFFCHLRYLVSVMVFTKYSVAGIALTGHY